MTSPSIFDSTFTFDRIKSFIDKSGSDELILLKGHLLIEEVLDWRISAVVGQENFKKLGLSYYKKVVLYCGLTKIPASSELITQILKINKIRNSFAHNLGATIQVDMLEIIKHFYGDLPKTISKNSTYLNSLKKLFYSTLGQLYGQNEVWEHENIPT